MIIRKMTDKRSGIKAIFDTQKAIIVKNKVSYFAILHL